MTLLLPELVLPNRKVVAFRSGDDGLLAHDDKGSRRDDCGEQQMKVGAMPGGIGEDPHVSPAGRLRSNICDEVFGLRPGFEYLSFRQRNSRHASAPVSGALHRNSRLHCGNLRLHAYVVNRSHVVSKTTDGAG